MTCLGGVLCQDKIRPTHHLQKYQQQHHVCQYKGENDLCISYLEWLLNMNMRDDAIVTLTVKISIKICHTVTSMHLHYIPIFRQRV